MITSNRLALLDSNILIYALDSASVFHLKARSLRDEALKANIQACVCPQVLVEFFAVITNPKRVKNPLPPQKAREEVEKYLNATSILKIYPSTDILERIVALLKKYEIKEAQIFDLQLVATMLANGVTVVYTYNQSDFARFKEIKAITP